MDLSSRVLGTHVVTILKQRTDAPVLMIGADRFTRADLASVTCFNFAAAQNLWKATVELGVKHTRDLYDRVPPAALALPRVGSIALAVLGAAFEAKGIGGEHPLENWMLAHAGDAHDEKQLRTFDTLKLRLQKERAQERKERKERKRARRDRAQKLRVNRYLERSERVQ